jgi:hypothetical protein
LIASDLADGRQADCGKAELRQNDFAGGKGSSLVAAGDLTNRRGGEIRIPGKYAHGFRQVVIGCREQLLSLAGHRDG